MEFLSPKTKARIAKLEAENAALKAQLEKNSSSGAKHIIWPFLLVIVALSSLAVYQYVNQKEEIPLDELAAMRVEIWHAGELTDTTFHPSDDVRFSVQIGAFKGKTIKELSYHFDNASLVEKDSLSLLTLGEYHSLLDAQKLLGTVVNLGVESAFIIAQKNGKAVGLLTEQNRE